MLPTSTNLVLQVARCAETTTDGSLKPSGQPFGGVLSGWENALERIHHPPLSRWWQMGPTPISQILLQGERTGTVRTLARRAIPAFEEARGSWRSEVSPALATVLAVMPSNRVLLVVRIQKKHHGVRQKKKTKKEKEPQKKQGQKALAVFWRTRKAKCARGGHQAHRLLRCPGGWHKIFLRDSTDSCCQCMSQIVVRIVECENAKTLA